MRGKQIMVNVPGTIRAVDRGDGICELTKEPDVLCIERKRERSIPRKTITMLGTAGIIGVVAVTIILMAPAFGVFFFALLTWVLFCGWATGE